MYKKRTDLALESRELHAQKGAPDGITVTERTYGEVRVTHMLVTEEGEQHCGRPSGTYVTAEIGAVWRAQPDAFETAVSVLADEIRQMLPAGDGCVLVAGLGNEHITADSIGPRVVDRLLVTRHIKTLDEALFASAGFGELSAVAAGVLGQTGIESAEIIKGVVSYVNPRCVIAIDALASRRLARLANTVQLSDTGISPGSGVSNHRAPLNRETLGVPVLSIGVPTVVDACTLAYDLLEESDTDPAVIERLIRKTQSGKDFFVTPRDSDALAEGASRLIAAAINLAVHDGMTLQELNEYQSAL
ncbi:MAG: GPR endopeptidase [Clostridia bacterium]|nr:GPR endopeptidase [Clostridia bacterium]